MGGGGRKVSAIFSAFLDKKHCMGCDATHSHVVILRQSCAQVSSSEESLALAGAHGGNRFASPPFALLGPSTSTAKLYSTDRLPPSMLSTMVSGFSATPPGVKAQRYHGGMKLL